MSKRAKFLMCAPEFFGVEYSINPWMNDQIGQVTGGLAKSQWLRLYQQLSEIADVELISPVAGSPDLVFTANAGNVIGNDFILSNFAHQERQAEEQIFERWFKEAGYKVHKLANVNFEGAGDCLLDRERGFLWSGYGFRTEKKSYDPIEGIFKYPSMTLELCDPHFYHMDTCLCPLQGGNLLYYPEAFTESSNAKIERLVPSSQRIPVSQADANRFACNAINVDQYVIVNQPSRDLAMRLRLKGYEVLEVELTEFLKSGGAAKCLTLRLDEPTMDQLPLVQSKHTGHSQDLGTLHHLPY